MNTILFTFGISDEFARERATATAVAAAIIITGISLASTGLTCLSCTYTHTLYRKCTFYSNLHIWGERSAPHLCRIPNTTPQRTHRHIPECAPFMQMCLMRWLGVDVWIERIETWEYLGSRWFDDMVSPLSPSPPPLRINPESVMAPSSSHALTPLAFRDNLCRCVAQSGQNSCHSFAHTVFCCMSHDARTQLLEKHKQTTKQGSTRFHSYTKSPEIPRNHCKSRREWMKIGS